MLFQSQIVSGACSRLPLFIEWPSNQHRFKLTCALVPNVIDWTVSDRILQNRSPSRWLRRHKVTSVIFKQHAPNVLINPFAEDSDANRYWPINNTDFALAFHPYEIIYLSNRIQRSALSKLLGNAFHRSTLAANLNERYVNASDHRDLKRILLQTLFKPSLQVLNRGKQRPFPKHEKYVKPFNVHLTGGPYKKGQI